MDERTYSIPYSQVVADFAKPFVTMCCSREDLHIGAKDKPLEAITSDDLLFQTLHSDMAEEADYIVVFDGPDRATIQDHEDEFKFKFIKSRDWSTSK